MSVCAFMFLYVLSMLSVSHKKGENHIFTECYSIYIYIYIIIVDIQNLSFDTIKDIEFIYLLCILWVIPDIM